MLCDDLLAAFMSSDEELPEPSPLRKRSKHPGVPSASSKPSTASTSTAPPKTRPTPAHGHGKLDQEDVARNLVLLRALDDPSMREEDSAPNDGGPVQRARKDGLGDSDSFVLRPKDGKAATPVPARRKDRKLLGGDSFVLRPKDGEVSTPPLPARLPGLPGPAAAADPKPTKARPGERAAKREQQQNFRDTRQLLASAFLKELDDTITGGKLAELAASTGGIKLNWNVKLNTTAGRAHWRKETVRSRSADGKVMSTTYRHHASIEMASKVIDDEDRLLNVIAHEFCHLANFMVTGMMNNPHGKEFKGWGAKCSEAFADRGIRVTTKHSYEIDFKYVWQCAGCGVEYKRHSKSIDPARARCGGCKGPLEQTKPKPRTAKASRYQEFVKEQMRTIRSEDPARRQRDMMKIIAERWAETNKAVAGTAGGPDAGAAADTDPDPDPDTGDIFLGRLSGLKIL